MGEILRVEAGSLALVDEETGNLVVRKTLGPGHDGISGRTAYSGAGLVGDVVESGEPKLVTSAERGSEPIDSIGEDTGFDSRTVLCVPLTIHDRVIGAIELVNKLGGDFTQQDVELLQAMAASVAVAVDNASLYSELSDFARELERSQAQLVQAEKMAAVGRMAASIAHEVNNPLQAIHNSLHLSTHHDVSEELRSQYLGVAQGEVERLIEIVQHMLDYYRPSPGSARPTDLNRIVENVLALAQKRLQHAEIEVHTDLSPCLTPVVVVPDQITQVLLNIVINAIEAMPSGGELHLQTSVSDDGNWTSVSCRDSGPGLSADQFEHLFEPFYTTKSSGTGLGLAISYGIIERHGGAIEVSSRPGQMTDFVVKLPLRCVAD
jgi:signal transduction histidine kinase